MFIVSRHATVGTYRIEINKIKLGRLNHIGVATPFIGDSIVPTS
jgi:hypothetical protein